MSRRQAIPHHIRDRLAKAKKARRVWFRGLISGEFKQGKGYLYNTNTDAYCCLGVACELGLASHTIGHALTSWDLEKLALTPSDQRELITLNDHDCVPFDLIAYLILRLPYEIDGVEYD